MRARTLGRAAIAALACLAASPASGASLTVGASSSVDLGSASVDLGEADLDVSGTFSAGTGTVDQARDVSIQPGGTLNGESAALNVCGDWTNSGTFNAGTGTVNFADGCGLTLAVISGNTTFASLDLTTTSGKLYTFTSGSTQTVTNSFTLLGATGNPLTLRSTLGGSAAFLDIQGTGSGDFVDVQDIDATAGNPITLGPNSVKGSNTPGWLAAALVPVLGALGLALLALSLVWSGLWSLVTRRESAATR
jgi:hypothetical protein